MKKILLGLCVILFLGPIASDVNAESLTCKFQNNSSDLVMLEFNSKSRPVAWPGNRKVFYLPADGQTHSYPISCIAGEKICYGAWLGSQPNYYWGAGRGARQGCSDCCYRCSGGESQTYNLNVGGCVAGVNCE